MYYSLGKKILVFVHHKAVMEGVEDFLRMEDVGFIRIDGEVLAKKRQVLIDRFQHDDQTEVALLSITACGTGLNLTRANVILMGELLWSTGKSYYHPIRM
jgi:SWI/SNF-related matrix-associated actin-dependent regulator 1 of chromatin subfamily A